MKTLVVAKVACAVSAVLMFGSVLMFILLGVFREPHRTLPGAAAAAHAPVAKSDGPTTPLRWLAPKPSSRDAAWTYEVFTPPEIYYDGATKKFTVMPWRTQETGEEVAKSGFELELLEVKRVPFRLQLVGYVGGDGSYLGTFENQESAETFLARAGRQLPELGLIITDFAVRRERVAIAQSAAVDELVATATVSDLRTKTETVLRHSERRYTEQLCARVRAATDKGEYEARAGDAIQVGATRYVIEKLQLNPPAAEVRKEASDNRPVEREILSITPIL